MRNVRFVYCDIGGTLLDYSHVFKTAALETGLGEDKINSCLMTNVVALSKGFMSPAEFWQLCRKEYGIHDHEKYDFLSSWMRDYRPISETHVMLERISGHYPVGLLSNIYKGMPERLIPMHLIPDLKYEKTVISCDIGMKKPEREIFEFAQELSCRPEQICLIDDKENVLETARSMGWQTVLFDLINRKKSVSGIKSFLDVE